MVENGATAPSCRSMACFDDKHLSSPGLWRGGVTSRFPRASQNIMAMATLPNKLPKADTSSEQKTQEEIWDLLSLAVRQQVKSSVSRRCELETKGALHLR